MSEPRTSVDTTSAAPNIAAAHRLEVEAGERFEFGKNWQAFLASLTPDRISTAVESLKSMLGVQSLQGKTFLDIGSGSGLFSLAAWTLGAEVLSFDYDEYSVACTRRLHSEYAKSDRRWRVIQGSVLDEAFVSSLGQFDVVYSWGVLHHTGQMWAAIGNAKRAVRPGGQFFIAIYNDQGAWSSRWSRIKRMYCSGPVGRWVVSGTFIPYWIVRGFVADLVWMRNPLARYRTYAKQRGMSVFHDWHDWLGGYPFEVAKPEDIIKPITHDGFALENLVTAGGSVGCVEYVFRRQSAV